MGNDEKVKYWIDISKYDLETAEAMLKSKKFLYVGFMCHQAIEKILKGYYYSTYKEVPPFTHNLTYLAEKCNIYKEFSDEDKDLIDTLEPLNVEARYPTYKKKLLRNLNHKNCLEILKKTKKLYQWIKKKLSKK